MTWWAWLLVFVALVILAVVYLFLRTRDVWRAAVRLFAEIGEASRKVEELTAPQRSLAPDPSSVVATTPARSDGPSGLDPALAVFDSPARLRQDRAQERARRRAGSRR